MRRLMWVWIQAHRWMTATIRCRSHSPDAWTGSQPTPARAVPRPKPCRKCKRTCSSETKTGLQSAERLQSWAAKSEAWLLVDGVAHDRAEFRTEVRPRPSAQPRQAQPACRTLGG